MQIYFAMQFPMTLLSWRRLISSLLLSTIRIALVLQTAGFFPAHQLSYRYTFGQVACANALSDVYAMGGRPVFALSIAGFPSNRLPLSVLERILRGSQVGIFFFRFEKQEACASCLSITGQGK
jgi:selenophosphate synthase